MTIKTHLKGIDLTKIRRKPIEKRPLYRDKIANAIRDAIASGFYDTIMNESILTNPVRSELFLGRIPAGRWGTPDDLKGAVIFLASAASDYVGGIILPVDGGHLAY